MGTQLNVVQNDFSSSIKEKKKEKNVKAPRSKTTQKTDEALSCVQVERSSGVNDQRSEQCELSDYNGLFIELFDYD